jgi:hypothetical protein
MSLSPAGETADRVETWLPPMNQLTIKTPNPKCRLIVVFNRVLTGDTVSNVGIFDPPCELAPL